MARQLLIADAVEYEEERYLFVDEWELEPLPFPSMTGFHYIGPPPKERRRQARPKAKAASA